MSTVNKVTLVPHIGQQRVGGVVKDVDMRQFILFDGAKRLGYVSRDVPNPPINLIGRVSEDDAAEIKRQVEALMGAPTRDIHMPARVTEALLTRASELLGPDGVPLEVAVDPDEDEGDEL